MKSCYSVAKPGMVNLVKGIFTNKKLLFEAMNNYAMSLEADVSFVGALNYENKKFNYSNMNKLLNSILVNESFSIQIRSKEKIMNIEITLHSFNHFYNN